MFGTWRFKSGSSAISSSSATAAAAAAAAAVLRFCVVLIDVIKVHIFFTEILKTGRGGNRLNKFVKIN